jgi:cardiolipin synthase
MLAAIDQARDTVLLSTFLFDNDRAGHRFADAMAAAVARGVEVRVLVDAVGARYTFPSILGRLRRHGVQARRFSPSLVPWRMRYANMRSHRKLMVVDGEVGFTGGLNIREACLLALQPARPTLDLHFRVEGPVVAEMQRTLCEDWEFTTGESLSGDRFFPPLELRGPVLARALADGPDSDHDPIRWHKLAAVARARERVRIVTPYFVPDPGIVSALNIAARNGVRVDVVLPSVNNLRVVSWASTALLWQVLEHGCRVHLTVPPFDHSKLLLVDDDLATIGSANWDARSFRLNFEFDLECRDRALAARLHQIVDDRMVGAREITLADVDARPIPIRLRDGIARLFAPYL